MEAIMKIMSNSYESLTIVHYSMDFYHIFETFWIFPNYPIFRISANDFRRILRFFEIPRLVQPLKPTEFPHKFLETPTSLGISAFFSNLLIFLTVSFFIPLRK